MSISVGDKIPNVKLVKATAEGPQPIISLDAALHYSPSPGHSRQHARHATFPASLKRPASLPPRALTKSPVPPSMMPLF